MGRGGVSAVARGAKPPNATAYEHLVVEDQRREWERTKEDLGAAKKQIAEKDDLILQLKTQVRKLQEMLQKKDKDLQAVFAVLRAPQDAELAKKRKQELIDRLVMEKQQRVVNAEAIAEERKKELGRLKYSSKFLRYQELEVELEEYRKEIVRLRAISTASASPSRHPEGVVVGKLKLSAALSSASESERESIRVKSNKVQTTKPHHGAPIRASSTNCNNTKTASRQDSLLISDPRSTTKGKVLLAAAAKTADPARKKESFVSKTRRRAQEAEYYKQVRLAQLEAECELEENIHIRTTREVKARLEAEKESREQQREAAAIREKIVALQQLRAVPEEDEEPELQQQQQNNAVVAILEVPSDPTTATPEQTKVVEKLEPMTDEKDRPRSAGESELSPGEAVCPVPDPVGEQEVMPVSSPTEEPITQPGEEGIVGEGDDIKASEDLDVYESFSEATKQQDQVPAIELKAEPAITDTTDEPKLAVGQSEIEHSEEDNGSEDEYPEEHDADAEIEELSTKDPGSPEKRAASYTAVDDPLEISGTEDEQEHYKSDAVAGGAVSRPETKAAADSDRSFGEEDIEDQVAKEPIDSSAAAATPIAAIPVSEHLYDEENFDDDPKEQNDEPEQTANEAAEQHRQGFFADLVDPHTKLAIPEAVNEVETHDFSAQEHRQGFLVDMVDPHSKVVIQNPEPLDADPDNEQKANDPKESSEFFNDPGQSVDDSPSRVEIAAESNSPDPPPSDTEGERNEPDAVAVDSGEIGSQVSVNIVAAEDDDPSTLEGSKIPSDEPVLDSGVPSSVVEVKHETPSQCFAQEGADAIPVQTESGGVHSDNSVVEHTALVVESTEELQDGPRAETAREDVIEKQITSGLEPADHVSDRIAADEIASILSVLHLIAAHEDVKEEEQVAATGSEATSPSCTPYSTPRDAESDDQHSQPQDSQEGNADDDAES